MKNVVYIHGAFSSSLSFSFISSKLPKHNAVLTNYAVETPVDGIVGEILDSIKHYEDVHIVSHSFGGIVAMLLSRHHPGVKSITTISTPFGGSAAATAMKWITPHELFKTIASSSPVLQSIKQMPIGFKMKSVVTTVGNNPLMYEPNDGVVSIKSQTALKHVEQIRLPLNHFEVLMSDETVDIVKSVIFD